MPKILPMKEGALAKLSEAVDGLRSLNLSMHTGRRFESENLGPLIKTFPISKRFPSAGICSRLLYYGLERSLSQQASHYYDMMLLRPYGDTGGLSGLASSGSCVSLSIAFPSFLFCVVR